MLLIVDCSGDAADSCSPLGVQPCQASKRPGFELFGRSKRGHEAERPDLQVAQRAQLPVNPTLELQARQRKV